MGQGERVILPASEAERLVQVIVLARSWFNVCVNQDVDDVGILVVGYGGDTTLERLLAQPNVQIAVHHPHNSHEAVEAPDGNEGPQVWLILAIENRCVAVMSTVVST